MASKFEVLLSAKLSNSSVENIKKQLKEISDGTPLTIKTDTKSIDDFAKKLKNVSNGANDAKDKAKGLGDIISKFSQWQIVGDIIHGVKDGIQDMVQQVFDLDESLTELDKVTDLTSEGLQNLADDAFEVGEKIGATGKDVIDATTIFSQAGYDVKDALDLRRTSNNVTKCF